MDYYKSLNDYFGLKLEKLDCDEILKSYIISIFSKYNSSKEDLSKQSLTIEYSIAKFNRDFLKFQNIGDYVFFSYSIFPDSLNGASKEYYCSLAQMSYYSCYTIVGRQLKLYEQMADGFIKLSNNTRQMLKCY